MKDLKTLKAAIDDGGVVTHNGEIISTHARLEEVHANYREPSASGGSGVNSEELESLKAKFDKLPKGVKDASARADEAEAKAVEAESRATAAEEALEPFQTRNEELANKVEEFEAFKAAMTPEQVAEIEKRIADAKPAEEGS